MPGERFLVAAPDSSEEDDISVFGESCQDINGRTITGGNHYVPGPDSCTVCLCDGGKPKWCQAVLCAAPKDCKSFRIGSSCCEFICLDDTEGGNDEGSIDVTWGGNSWTRGDLSWHLVATAVTIFLVALLAFLIYRLKRRRARRHSACHELEDDIPSSSIASYDHGDLTSSTGHLSRQPQPVMNLGEHQSPICVMWKLPSSSANENPPPYSENPSSHQTMEDGENIRETTCLLAVPSAPANDLVNDISISHVSMVRRSNDTLDSDDFLDAGTPPPSYAEVLACNSTPAINEIEENFSPVREEDEDETPSTQWRNSLNLPRESSPAEVTIQRFSLQLALDCSDTSSCTSSSSHAQPGTLSTSSSSSAASIAHLGSH